MKKILVAIDATHLDKVLLENAIHLAKPSNALIVGVLLHDIRYLNYVYGSAWDQPVIDFPAVEEAENKDKSKIKLVVKEFENICKEHGVHFKIHLDSGVPLDTLIQETIYADFLLINSRLNFISPNTNELSQFVKDVMHDAKCPVIVASNPLNKIQQNILCYDGSYSSMKAIKMYTYNFPENTELPTTILFANENTGNHLIDQSNFKDWLSRRYTQFEIKVLHGIAEQEVYKFLKKEGANSMVIMGAYGRSALSRFLHQSVSNSIIEKLQLPIFISHE